MAKRVRMKKKKFISPKFILLSWNESDLDIPILTPVRLQKLAYEKSILKYSDDSVKENADDNLLSDNFLGNNLLDDDSPTYIDSNINIDTKAKLNSVEDMTSDKLLEENSEINIEDLFQ